MHCHRADPSNEMSGGDYRWTRSPWGYRWRDWCWHLLAPPSTPDFFGKVGLNLALGLVTSCWGCQIAWWRPICCWLGWVCMVLGYGKLRYYFKPNRVCYFRCHQFANDVGCRLGQPPYFNVFLWHLCWRSPYIKKLPFLLGTVKVSIFPYHVVRPLTPQVHH